MIMVNNDNVEASNEYHRLLGNNNNKYENDRLVQDYLDESQQLLQDLKGHIRVIKSLLFGGVVWKNKKKKRGKNKALDDSIHTSAIFRAVMQEEKKEHANSDGESDHDNSSSTSDNQTANSRRRLLLIQLLNDLQHRAADLHLHREDVEQQHHLYHIDQLRALISNERPQFTQLRAYYLTLLMSSSTPPRNGDQRQQGDTLSRQDQALNPHLWTIHDYLRESHTRLVHLQQELIPELQKQIYAKVVQFQTTGTKTTDELLKELQQLQDTAANISLQREDTREIAELLLLLFWDSQMNCNKNGNNNNNHNTPATLRLRIHKNPLQVQELRNTLVTRLTALVEQGQDQLEEYDLASISRRKRRGSL